MSLEQIESLSQLATGHYSQYVCTYEYRSGTRMYLSTPDVPVSEASVVRRKHCPCEDR
jgi:hypothetical protein